MEQIFCQTCGSYQDNSSYRICLQQGHQTIEGFNQIEHHSSIILQISNYNSNLNQFISEYELQPWENLNTIKTDEEQNYDDNSIHQELTNHQQRNLHQKQFKDNFDYYYYFQYLEEYKSWEIYDLDQNQQQCFPIINDVSSDVINKDILNNYKYLKEEQDQLDSQFDIYNQDEELDS